jgi:hypothetical protein
LIINYLSNDRGVDQYGNYKRFSPLALFFRDLWIHFYKYPIDTLSINNGCVQTYNVIPELRNWFFTAEWYLAFDLIEFCSSYNKEFKVVCNGFLKREMSAYRFVEDVIVEINSKEEVIEIESAIKNSDKFSSVRTHLTTSLELLSDKKKPDYRNSIKEAISAVEAISKIITKNNSTTLGQALTEIEKKHSLPKSLKTAFSALYGYTSDKGGIRHSLLEQDVKVDFEEARFMLITCSAFVNYLLNKLD